MFNITKSILSFVKNQIQNSDDISSTRLHLNFLSTPCFLKHSGVQEYLYSSDTNQLQNRDRKMKRHGR